jgi:hypothetical protein
VRHQSVAMGRLKAIPLVPIGKGVRVRSTTSTDATNEFAHAADPVVNTAVNKTHVTSLKHARKLVSKFHALLTLEKYYVS